MTTRIQKGRTGDKRQADPVQQLIDSYNRASIGGQLDPIASPRPSDPPPENEAANLKEPRSDQPVD